MKLTALAAFAAALGLAVARAVPNGHVLHEKRDIPKAHLSKRVAQGVKLPMRIGLKQNKNALYVDLKENTQICRR